MANQSMRQEIIQSIVNSQLQQAIKANQQEESNKIRADFENWQKQTQEESNKIRSDFDAWMQANPLEETPQAQPVQPIIQATQPQKQQTTIPELQKAEKPNMEDYMRQQQEEQMLASGNGKKKQKENPLKSDYLAIRTQQDLNNKDTKAIQTNKVSKWLDTSTKLSDQGKKEARAYAQAELAKFDYNSSKQPVLSTPEERQRYSDMVNLLNKTNGLTNAMTGVIKQPLNLAKTVRDVGRDVGNQLTGLGAAVTDKLGITEGATQRHNEKVDAANAFYNQNDESMQRAYENAKTQNPGATMLGEVGGQIGMYALTNPVFDSFGAAAGLGKAGSFALNQVGQNLQDVALDTLPTLNQYLDDNTLSDEEKKALLANVGINAAGNLVMGGVGLGWDALKKNKAAKKAANEAFRANVNEGADLLAKLANPEDVDNVVRNATKQANEAAQSLENITKQMPEVPENAAQSIKLGDNTKVWNDVYDVTNYHARPVNDLAESVAKANNPELSAAYDNMRSALDNLDETLINGNDINAMRQAKKDFDNAVRKFSQEAKKVDPSLTKGLNDKNARGSMDKLIDELEEFYNPNKATKEAQEAADAIIEMENGNKVMAESADFSNSEKIEPLKIEEEVPPTETVRPKNSGPEDGELKERGQSKHIRGEGAMQMEGVSDEVVSSFQDDPDMYKVLRNADTTAKAQNIYNNSENPMTEFRDMLRKKDPAALPLGHQLAKDFSAAGDHNAAAQIYREMGEELTKAGQFTQAAVINMMKNDPLTAMQYAVRQIDQLNTAGAQKFGKKWKNFDLTDAEKEMFDKIKPGDEEAIKAAFDQIGTRIGKDYPTTWLEKLLEGRKVAMLFNLRTMSRNTLANVPTRYMRKFSDRLEAVGQNIVHLIDPEYNVTQSLTGGSKADKKLATEIYNSKQVQEMIKGTPGKYEIPELKNSLLDNKQMFKGTLVDRFIDKYTGKAFNRVAEILGKDARIDGGIQALNKSLYGKEGVQSALETIRNTTYKMLDMGDSPFVKGNFVDRLSSYIKAQGIKNIDDVPDEAIEMAWEEAMKATYKDNSWAVKMTQGVKKGIGSIPYVGKPLSEALIPFVQAPANIAARMVDYSPLRGSKGLYDIIRGAISSDPKQLTKGIEEASKGLTGTAAAYLGYKLYEAGILTGAYSEDADQKAFQKQHGFREYALRYGKDKYYTLNWMQPAFQNLMAGVIVGDAIKNSDDYDSMLLEAMGYDDTKIGKAIGVSKQAAKGSLNSWFDQSTMQSIEELFGGGYGGQKDIAGNIADIAVNDFAGSFVPSTVNAIAKTNDTTQRNTTDKSNVINNFVAQQKAKLPGSSETLPAKYDTWGNEMKYANSKGEAAFNRFLNPGEGTTDTSDRIDNEIMNLYEESGENAAVFPPVAYYKVGDKTLNNEEVSEYQKDMGTRNRKFAESFIDSVHYDKYSAEDKADTLDTMYKLSKAISERDMFGKEISDSSANKKLAAIYDKSGVKGVIKELDTRRALEAAGVNDSESARAILKDKGESGLKTYGNIKKKLNGSTSAESVQKALDSTSMMKSEKATYYSYLKPDSTPGQNPYGYIPGLNYDPSEDKAYQAAKAEIPSLKPVEYYKTKDTIDADSSSNISQEELIIYITNNNLSDEKAQQYWAAYGGWTNKKGETKKLVKKNGKWVAEY